MTEREDALRDEASPVPPEEPATIELACERHDGAWTLEAAAAVAPRVLFPGEVVEIGSRAGADLRLLEPSVSARHCRVRVDAGALVVDDLGSTNGVWVGGARVGHARLAGGATFVAGRVVVTCATRRAPDAAGDAPFEPLPGVVGTSLAMWRVTRELRRIAPVRGPVLLRGETGTGKDVLARALHLAGPRRARPFVPINVGTLPRELAEAELFGHERGAYTGAHASREGAFVEANGGTLFLDEIGELPLDLQVKLLRVLEDGIVRPVGGKPRKVDVRIVSATWAPLERRLGEGTFRHDLWQRLAVFVIDVPPLRERRTDIVSLAEKTLLDVRDEVGPRALTPAAIARLAAHAWPGNVRELRNVVYRAALRAPGRAIRAEDVAESVHLAAPARTVLTVEQARALLESHAGNVSAAARQLGVPRSTFRGWLAQGR